MKPVILAIVGPSGSGKSTLSSHLKSALNIPFIVSFTTRAMRVGEIDGIDHIFVSENDIPSQDDMLAYTFFGGNHYWTVKSQIPASVCSYVIDEAGLLELLKFSDKYDVIPVLIRPDFEEINNFVDEARRSRDNNRKKLSEDSFAIILDNDCPLQSFLQKATKAIKYHLDTNLK